MKVDVFSLAVCLVPQTVSVPEFDGRGLSVVRKFDTNQLAANTPNEDRRSAATCLQVFLLCRAVCKSIASL